MIVMTFFKKGEVSGLGEIGLIIQQVEDPHWLFGQHVQDSLVVLKNEKITLKSVI